MNADQMKAMFCLDRIVWGALASTLNRHEESSESNSSEWSIRDVYLNFARWLNHSNAYIEAYCAGKREHAHKAAAPQETIANWQQQGDQISLEEAKEKARKAFARRLEVIGYNPPGNVIREAVLRLNQEPFSLSRCRLVQ